MSTTDPFAEPQGPAGDAEERPRRSGRLPNLAERLAELDRKLSEQPAPEVAPNATTAQNDMSYTSFSSLSPAEAAPVFESAPVAAPLYETAPVHVPSATYAAPIYAPAPVHEPAPTYAPAPVYEPAPTYDPALAYQAPTQQSAPAPSVAPVAPAAPVAQPEAATPVAAPAPSQPSAPAPTTSVISPSTETIKALRDLYAHRDSAQSNLVTADKPVDYTDKLARAHTQLAEAEKVVDEYVATNAGNIPSRDSDQFGATPAGELLALRTAVVKDLSELNQDYEAWVQSTGRALHDQIARISDDVDATERTLLARFETLESELPRYDAATLEQAQTQLAALDASAKDGFEGQLLQAKVDFLELQAVRSERIKESPEGVAKLGEQVEIAKVLLDPNVVHGPSIQTWFGGLSADRRVFFASLTTR